MFGFGKKYRLPSHLVSAVREMRGFKDPLVESHVRLKDGKEFVVVTADDQRIVGIRGYTYLPFLTSEIEVMYQTEEDEHGTCWCHDPDFVCFEMGLAPYSSDFYKFWWMKLGETVRRIRGGSIHWMSVAPIPELPPGDPFWQRMQAIWADQKRRGHVPSSGQEVQAEHRALRDEWDERSQRHESIQEEAEEVGRQPM
jgi:hypothetical protein